MPFAATPSFGLFSQGRGLRAWESRAVALLQEHGLRCVVLSSGAGPATGSRPGAGEGWLRRFSGLDIPALASIPAEPKADGSAGAGKFAFILFFGPGRIPAELFAQAAFGVWRFSDPGDWFAPLPILEQLCRRQNVVTFSLDAYQKPEEEGRAIAGGRFRARDRTAAVVCQEVLEQSARWPARAFRHVQLAGRLPDPGMLREARHAFVGPARATLAMGVRRLACAVKVKLLGYLVLETWDVGLLRTSPKALLDGGKLDDVAWLPALRPGCYLADPFILSTEPNVILFAEAYDPREQGTLVRIRVEGGLRDPRRTCVEPLLNVGRHLSYPYLFQDNGTTYCLPECYQSNRSTLYRLGPDGGLLPTGDLIAGVPVTDGSIVFHQGHYWLFCALQNDCDHLNLYLFFADRLDGEWHPHPLNPVKTDVTSSRPGGQMFVVDGKLFRPAQDCSYSYGSALAINRVDELSTTAFRETRVASVTPEQIGPRCYGVHTLSFVDNVVAIDAKRYLVGWQPIAVKARLLLARLGARIGWRRRPPGAVDTIPSACE